MASRVCPVHGVALAETLWCPRCRRRVGSWVVVGADGAAIALCRPGGVRLDREVFEELRRVARAPGILERPRLALPRPALQGAE